MKKSTIAALLVASLLIVVGIILGVIAGVSGAFHPNYEAPDAKEGGADYVANDVLTIECFDDSNTIRVVPSQRDGVLSVRYYNDRYNTYSSELKDGTLTVSVSHPRLQIGIFFAPRHPLIIEVPKDYAGNIRLCTASGKIDLAHISAKSVTAETSSGRIQLSDLKSTDTVTAKTASGRISIEDSFIDKNLTISTASGGIELEGVDVKGRLIAVSTSGRQEFDGVSATDYHLTASSGRIDASLYGSADEYDIDATSSSGRVDIPRTIGRDKTIKAHTSSGGIRIRLIGQKPQ